MRRWGLSVTFLAALVVTACDDSDDDLALWTGIRRQPGDRVEVRVGACDPRVRVHEVLVFSQAGAPGDAGELLWGIAADTGGPLGTYSIGQIPPDFQEVSPLTAPLQPGGIFRIVVDLNGYHVTPSGRQVGRSENLFELGELSETDWLSLDERPVSTVEFDAQGTELC